ncbi:MAG: hypothetical protein WKF37_19020 [Bryobacteraceae bacterium]
MPQPSVTGYNGKQHKWDGSNILPQRRLLARTQPDEDSGEPYVEVRREIRRSTQLLPAEQSIRELQLRRTSHIRDPFAAAGTGNGFASFLLGYGTGGGITQNSFVAAQIIYRALHAGDQWRVSNRIPLNYGLRYEQMGPWSERYDRLSVLLPDAPNDLSSVTGLKLKGRLGLVNSPDSESRNNQKLGHLFSPRIGVAYRVTNSTVLRTGYGIFYLPNDIRWNMVPNNDAVNSFNNPFNETLDGSLTPQDTLGNPFPTGLRPTPGRSANLQQIFYGQNVNAAVFNDRFSYAQQWNFDVQHELPAGMALSMAYAGSKGTHLPGPDQQLNQLPPEFMALGSRLQEQVTNPFFGQVSLGTLAQPRVAYGQLLRPYPQYTGFAMKNPTNRNSIYHSAQLKLEKRFGAGGSILGAYTWSKLISDTDTITGWLEPGGGAGGVQDNYNLRAERSLALYDTPHRAVISYIVDLPFGKGQRFGTNVTGFTDKLVSGWGVNGVTTFQSGNPLPISVAVNTSNSFGGGQRPNRTGQPANLDGSAQSRLGQWFNTAAFSLPAPFTFGNSSRTMPDMRSHGIANYDFTLFKNTNFTETVGLQFRAEIFNMFNRVRFGYPGTALGNPQFGIISGQYNDPRLVQLALRLIF